MNRPRIASMGIALALACTASAASAAVYYRDTYVTREPVQVVRVERVTYPEVIAYNDRYVTYTVDSPRIVERRYVAPRETVVVRADPVVVTGRPIYPTTHWDPRHPHWGHLIGYGLFNNYGPNDFGR